MTVFHVKVAFGGYVVAKVYVLIQHECGDSSTIRGVYSDFEQAKFFRAGMGGEIEEFVLNKDCEYIGRHTWSVELGPTVKYMLNRYT